MRAFSFSLGDVLEFRKFEQKQAEIELGKALSSENEIQKKLDALALQKITVQKDIRDSKDFSEIAGASAYFDFIKRESESLFEKMAEARLLTEKRREELKLAMQKVDSLENLKENELSEYKRMALSEEDTENDDIATSRIGLSEAGGFQPNI